MSHRDALQQFDAFVKQAREKIQENTHDFRCEHQGSVSAMMLTPKPPRAVEGGTDANNESTPADGAGPAPSSPESSAPTDGTAEPQAPNETR